MRGICFKISFYEAFFRVFLTMKYRLSYPIPLPTHIAGMLGSILGLKRENNYEFFRDCYFGAGTLGLRLLYENTTLVEITENERSRSIEKCLIINNPTYVVTIFGGDEKINTVKKALREYSFKFLPFGGQNDFFLRKIKFLSDISISNSKRINSGYILKEMIENFDKNTKIMILPVKYKNKVNEFTFIIRGDIFLKNEIKVSQVKVNGYELIFPIYKLSEFEYKL